MSQTLTLEKKLAEALKVALREMEHMRSHDFQCAGLDAAILDARNVLKEYEES